MADALATKPASPGREADLATGEAGPGRLHRSGAYLALLPFFGYVTLFLLLPTLIVVVGAFQDANGNLTLDAIRTVLGGDAYRQAFTSRSSSRS